MELLLRIARETNGVLPKELDQYAEKLFKPALSVLLEGRNPDANFYLPAFRAVLLKFMGQFVERKLKGLISIFQLGEFFVPKPLVIVRH